jgi:hypothetical protein
MFVLNVLAVISEFSVEVRSRLLCVFLGLFNMIGLWRYKTVRRLDQKKPRSASLLSPHHVCWYFR